MKDLEILLKCNQKIADRYEAVTGGNSPKVLPKGNVDIESMMHGDLINAADIDWYAQRLGALQIDEMMGILEDQEETGGGGFTLQGGLVGMAEQCIVLGIMFERERLRLVRAGVAEPKPRDYEDGWANDEGVSDGDALAA